LGILPKEKGSLLIKRGYSCEKEENYFITEDRGSICLKEIVPLEREKEISSYEKEINSNPRS